MSFIEDRKETRFTEVVSGKILSNRTYNLVLGTVLLYGIIANVVLTMLIGDKLNDINPIAFIIGYFVLGITGIVISTKSHNPLISFFGYNLVVVPVGTVVSIVVSAYVKEGNIGIVFQAILYTAIVTGIMVCLSIIYPQFFSKIGGILLACLIGLLIAEIVAIFVFPGTQIVTAWIGAILFSLYIGFDYWKAQQYPKTLDNAVDSALDIYLDIINLFLRILKIRGNSSSSSKK